MRLNPLMAIIKNFPVIYLLLAGCIFLSNYRLPDKTVPTVSYQATLKNDKFHNYLLVDLISDRLLNREETNNKKILSPPFVTKPLISKKAKVAIIIDDVGYNPSILREIAKIPIPLTGAFLPYTPYLKECLKEATVHGFEIMLHLPLEPLDPSHNPGPGLIRHNWSEAEIERQLTRDLDAVPGAKAINNHMGSLGTQDPYLMACLMKIIHTKKLFFIDSRTTAKSVAEKYALEYQVPFAKRRVFIDNDDNPTSKKAALRELLKIALRDGSAIGIAHGKDGNATVITEMLPEFIHAGIEFVLVSELVK